MAKTSASFTLMDYTDGISLLSWIDSNKPQVSQYDTDTQTLYPAWTASSPLVLTPRLFKAGSTNSLISSATPKAWYRRMTSEQTWTLVADDSTPSSVATNESMNASTGVLTVSSSKLTGTNIQVEYKFAITYTDPTLNLAFPTEMVITFSRVSNGTSFVVARAYTENGDCFKNSSPASLPIKAELIRGNVADTSLIGYQWQIYDLNSAQFVDLTERTGHYTGVTSATLTVYPAGVQSYAMFRCKLTDNDPNSDTYEDIFYSEGVSILDLSDAYQAVIESTAGAYFKNNTGSTILICMLYQNGDEIDPTGSSLSYTWTKTDKDGNSVQFTPSPTAVQGWRSRDIVATNSKAITVSNTDVNVKATFFCRVD